MPVAIKSERNAEAESDAAHEGSYSAAEAAPGPSIALLRFCFIQPS